MLGKCVHLVDDDAEQGGGHQPGPGRAGRAAAPPEPGERQQEGRSRDLFAPIGRQEITQQGEMKTTIGVGQQ